MKLASPSHNAYGVASSTALPKGGIPMTHRTTPDTIPLSALNTLIYCPRRFHYHFVQGDTLVNELVLEGYG